MKYHPIVYWAATGLVSAMMLLAAGAYLMHAPQIMATFAHLGYPVYFGMILGAAKILGVCALLAPALPIVKEWAYAGFGITFISAFISHLESGDGAKALLPMLALALLAISYLSRPASRTCAIGSAPAPTDWRVGFGDPAPRGSH